MKLEAYISNVMDFIAMLWTSRRAWWLCGKFGALHLQDHRFEPHSSCHIGTLGKSFTHNCLYDVMGCPLCGCLAVKFDSYDNLLSSVHTLLVNILQ